MISFEEAISMECEKIGIPISEFADLAIQSMLPISETLGL